MQNKSIAKQLADKNYCIARELENNNDIIIKITKDGKIKVQKFKPKTL